LFLLFFAAAAFAGEMPSDARVFLDKNCAGCHRGASAPGGLDVSALPFALDEVNTFSRWVRVYDAVLTGAMPPGGKPVGGREPFLAALGTPLAAHQQAVAMTQGRAVLRRLNRYEYENTIRDLLAAPWLQLRDSLPEDGVVNRFNKVGQALDVSHVQMARYMETAEQAMRQVLAAAQQPEATKRYYAREQKRFLSRMRYSSFNTHPERATIPVLGVEAQPEVLHERAPITVGEADPKTRELEAFATPASNYVGNEHHFDQFVAPAGGRYRLRFSAYSIWIHTLYGPEGHKTRPAWWRPKRCAASPRLTTFCWSATKTSHPIRGWRFPICSKAISMNPALTCGRQPTISLLCGLRSDGGGWLRSTPKNRQFCLPTANLKVTTDC